jgi:hypothetical protein
MASWDDPSKEMNREEIYDFIQKLTVQYNRLDDKKNLPKVSDLTKQIMDAENRVLQESYSISPLLKEIKDDIAKNDLHSAARKKNLSPSDIWMEMRAVQDNPFVQKKYKNVGESVLQKQNKFFDYGISPRSYYGDVVLPRQGAPEELLPDIKKINKELKIDKRLNTVTKLLKASRIAAPASALFASDVASAAADIAVPGGIEEVGRGSDIANVPSSEFDPKYNEYLKKLRRSK